MNFLTLTPRIMQEKNLDIMYKVERISMNMSKGLENFVNKYITLILLKPLIGSMVA